METTSSTAKLRMPTEIPREKAEYLIQRTLELGAKKAKIIDTHAIVVEEWVAIIVPLYSSIWYCFRADSRPGTVDQPSISPLAAISEISRK